MIRGIHEIRIQELTNSPTLTTLCAGYETGSWRARQLVDDLFARHLSSFALSFTDFQSITGDTAALMLRKAADAVYSTEKYQLRGEFGELFLHAAARDFFGAQPAVSKIHFKDGPNETVKGFDSVHIVENDGEVEVWLGEVKFYNDLNRAIRDVVKELKDHLAADFLRREFVAITNKIDPQWPHAERLIDLLHANRSLDQIIENLVVPVMLTYDSAAVQTHDRLDEQYITALNAEARSAWRKFERTLDIPFPVTLHLILVPLESKAAIISLLHKKLKAWQDL